MRSDPDLFRPLIDVKAFIIDWFFPDWNLRDENTLECNQDWPVSVDLPDRAARTC
jgi:hypothetical protein